MRCIGLYIRKSIHSIIYKISKEDWRGQGEGGGVRRVKYRMDKKQTEK